MYSGEAPPSFSSAGINGYDQEQLQIPPAGDAYNQPPSYGSMGHGQGDSHNQFQTGLAYRGLDQITGVNVDHNQPPSFTALGHAQVNSYNHDGNYSREVGDSGQPPSVSAMAKVSLSQTSGGVDSYSDEKLAPNRSAVNGRETSQTGASESENVFELGPDAHEFAGMSLVGKNFRRFYPNAYYKEKDGEN